MAERIILSLSRESPMTHGIHQDRARDGMRLVLLTTLGWGFAWALGISLVFFVDFRPGWIVMGATGGFTTSVALRCSGAMSHNRRMLPLVAAWAAGGALSTAVTRY